MPEALLENPLSTCRESPHWNGPPGTGQGGPDETNSTARKLMSLTVTNVKAFLKHRLLAASCTVKGSEQDFFSGSKMVFRLKSHIHFKYTQREQICDSFNCNCRGHLQSQRTACSGATWWPFPELLCWRQVMSAASWPRLLCPLLLVEDVAGRRECWASSHHSQTAMNDWQMDDQNVLKLQHVSL